MMVPEKAEKRGKLYAQTQPRVRPSLNWVLMNRILRDLSHSGRNSIDQELGYKGSSGMAC